MESLLFDNEHACNLMLMRKVIDPQRSYALCKEIQGARGPAGKGEF